MDAKLITLAVIGFSILVVYNIFRNKYVASHSEEVMKEEENNIFGAIEGANSIDDLNEADFMIQDYDYKYQSYQGVADKVTKMNEALQTKQHEIIKGVVLPSF